MNPPVGFTDTVSAPSQACKYDRLSPELVEQLISVCRTMFPHDTVPDGFYEHVVRKLDEQATRDENFSRFLSDGVEALSREAGVSITTVSHVLNGTRHVNEKTVERVREAIAITGYQPHSIARALAGAPTETRS